MRYGFRLNTDIFETNIVNLSLVIGVVVTVVGEAIEDVLTQRKQKIQLIFQAIDKEVDSARLNWDEANMMLEIARIRSETIRIQSKKIIQERDIQEHEQLKNQLVLLQIKTMQSIQSDRRQKLRIAAQEIIRLRFTKVKGTLLKSFAINYNLNRYIRHKKMNQIFHKNIGTIG
jgi:F-type H+-transporting ATPase subunit b